MLCSNITNVENGYITPLAMKTAKILNQLSSGGCCPGVVLTTFLKRIHSKRFDPNNKLIAPSGVSLPRF